MSDSLLFFRVEGLLFTEAWDTWVKQVF